jgi:RNA polymerase sigma-70 factor (ECF subfamily)
MVSGMAGHPTDVTAAVLISAPPAKADFSAIYDEHVDGVWRLLERFGVPESGLEDAVQEVFITAHRRLAEFRGDSTLKTWLGGIAVRVAKDVRRGLARKGGHEPLNEGLPQGGPQLEDTVGQRQALSRVLRLLDALDDEQREVFVLAELEGMTAPEISEATGVNVNTVYTRLRAARQRFDDLVASRGGGLR